MLARYDEPGTEPVRGADEVRVTPQVGFPSPHRARREIVPGARNAATIVEEVGQPASRR